MKVNGDSSEIDGKRWIPPVSFLDFIQEKSVVKLVGRHKLGSVRGRNFFDGVAWKRESSRVPSQLVLGHGTAKLSGAMTLY